MNYQKIGFIPENSYPVKDNHKMDLENFNIKNGIYITYLTQSRNIK